MIKKKLVIIGAGPGGATVAIRARELGWAGEIILCSAERTLPYDRPSISKDFLLQQSEIEKIQLYGEEVYCKYNINVVLDGKVVELDRASRQIRFEGRSDSLEYSYLVLATGSRPRRFEDGLNNVGQMEREELYFRTILDAKRLAQTIYPGIRIGIIGAGYLGLELAAVSNQLGAEVTVIETAPQVLARVTARPVADYLEKLHRDRGVVILKGVDRIKLYSRKKDERLEWEIAYQGKRLICEKLIIAIGSIPNMELAAASGLMIDDGITANLYCQTEDECVYAIGDCAAVYDEGTESYRRSQTLPCALAQAEVAARNIAGRENFLYRPFPWFWTTQYESTVRTVGRIEGYEEIYIVRTNKKSKFGVVYIKKDKITAIDSVNYAILYAKAREIVAGGGGLSDLVRSGFTVESYKESR